MGSSSNKGQSNYRSFNIDPSNFCIVKEQKFNIISNAKGRINNNNKFNNMMNYNQNFNYDE